MNKLLIYKKMTIHQMTKMKSNTNTRFPHRISIILMPLITSKKLLYLIRLL